MSLNSTPSCERTHIGIFGRRNAGKSSLINALTGQQTSVVSEKKGTTTDPVYKAMELFPLGPVMLIDTPGIDDGGKLGSLRVRRTHQILNRADIALLVIDSTTGITEEDKKLWYSLHEKSLPSLLVFNKADMLCESALKTLEVQGRELMDKPIFVSTVTGYNINSLKEELARIAPSEPERRLVGDLLEPGTPTVLVIPIDGSAPKGRLILPQQQVLREIMDNHVPVVAVQPEELPEVLKTLKVSPQLVITDSQVFAKVNEMIPPDIPLTSFSILMARYKGTLYDAVRSVRALKDLQDTDKILISEGCTHHRQCQDIGTVKIPAWIRTYTGKDPAFEYSSGRDFPDDLTAYSLIVHCGGCMLNEKEMLYRGAKARSQNVPMTNYGILIAQVNGILKRILEPFPEFKNLL